MSEFATTPSQSGSRVDWTRATRAVKYVEQTLGVRFHANGRVRNAENRGWLRNRLRELLESFQTADEAQRWVEAATFKARGKQRPMAYFAWLVGAASAKPRLLDPAKLLLPQEFSAWLSERSAAKPGGGP